MQTTTVTEGAMCVTIMVLLSILNSIFGLLGFLVAVPIAVLVYRHSLKAGAVASLVAALLLSLVLMSPLYGLDLMVTSIVGIALGLALKEQFKFNALFGAGVGSSIIASLLRIFSFSAISGFSVFDAYSEAMESISGQSLGFLENMGIPDQIMTQYSQQLAALPDMAKMMMPIILVAIGMLETIVALFFLRVVMNRLGVSIPRAEPFSRWKWPWYFVWGFILSKALLIVEPYVTSSLLRTVVINTDLFFTGAFIIQGLAIVWHYLAKSQISKALVVFVAALLLISGNIIIYYFLIMFGVLDTWFDFRKIKL